MAERVGLWKDGWSLGDSELELSAREPILAANNTSTLVGDLGKREVGRRSRHAIDTDEKI